MRRWDHTLAPMWVCRGTGRACLNDPPRLAGPSRVASSSPLSIHPSFLPPKSALTTYRSAAAHLPARAPPLPCFARNVCPSSLPSACPLPHLLAPLLPSQPAGACVHCAALLPAPSDWIRRSPGLVPPACPLHPRAALPRQHCHAACPAPISCRTLPPVSSVTGCATFDRYLIKTSPS